MIHQVGYNKLEPVFTCDGTAGGSRAATLPTWAPDPCYIVRASLLNQTQAIPPGGAGIWYLILDKGGVFVQESGYPASQNGSMEKFIPLVRLQLLPGWPIYSEQTHQVPIRYSLSEGDLILVDVPCVGNFSSQPVWTVCWMEEDHPVP